MTPITQQHNVDDNGNPAGGETHGIGFSVEWQNGPLVISGERVAQSGAYVESIIEAAIGRIEFYQNGKFHSLANAIALGNLRAALEVLKERTRDREDRNVEGTHAI